MPDFVRVFGELKLDEGCRKKPYVDTAGVMTVGYGRNLQDTGIRQDEAEYLLWNDLRFAWDGLIRAYPWVQALNDARQEVLINMAVNLGLTRLGQFKKMLNALRASDWERAADEMLDSKWATQVGKRAERLAAQMRDGVAR